MQEAKVAFNRMEEFTGLDAEDKACFKISYVFSKTTSTFFTSSNSAYIDRGRLLTPATTRFS